MTSCTYASVVTHLASFAGEDATALQAADQTAILTSINRRLTEAWNHWDWPEAMRSQRRFYRPNYSAGATYAVGSQVYYPAARQYYQALRACTGQAPAALSGTTYTTNTAYWIVCDTAFTGDDWAASTAYVAGDRRRSLEDGLFYACHTAHTSSTTFDATKFGLLTDFVPYIGYEQSGQLALGVVRGVFREDVEQNPRARRVAFTLNASGVVVTEPSPPLSVWVRFRLSVTEMTGADAQEFPLWLRNTVACGAYADWLRGDGQTDKAMVEDQNATQFLLDETSRVVGQSGQMLRWRMA